jgi:transcriptional regulator with XRE-family HTH domain
LTQRAAAELAGVGISSIYALEDASDRLTLEILMRILDTLGLALVVAPPAALPDDSMVVVLNRQQES